LPGVGRLYLKGAAFLLVKNGIAISMDDKGAGETTSSSSACGALVNTTRSISSSYDSVSEARTSIGRDLDFCNPTSEQPSAYVIGGRFKGN
jgi:putative transposase